MPELISAMARWSSVASFCSTIASTAPSASRTIAAVAGRVGHHGGDDGDGAAGRRVRLEQDAQRLRGEQGHVAVRHEHGALQVGGEGRQAALDRPAGALDLVLVGDDRVGVDVGDVLGDAVALVPDDDREVCRVHASRRGDRVAEQGPPADGVQHLRLGRAHAHPLARGEDDDGGRAGIGHARESIGAAAASRSLAYSARYRWTDSTLICSYPRTRSGSAAICDGSLEGVGPEVAKHRVDHALVLGDQLAFHPTDPGGAERV